ncbi:hypothetical protein [Actinorugispora endophytica]|uniref:Uncharacterized protein n=1 Tax=Actinorugispora endophytica TaxID=1605990 RepID=A0A4R6V3G9_9ACTN|nr:hypothetical protein [Actinorugispora endophytica]TDQ54754.1 hypothetical protein EV190_10170 [Actinorugispora endophytica]
MNGLPTQTDQDDEPGSASPIRQMSLWPPPRSTRHSNRRARGMLVVAAAVLGGLVVVGGGVAWALFPEGEADADEAGAGGEGGIPAAYAGNWSGEMSQHDEAGEPVVDWGASLKLDEGTGRGSADWFTLGCRGSVTLVEDTGDSLVFEYAETYDPENHCIDETILTLSPGAGGGTLEAEWVATSRSGTVMTSVGTLK